MKISKKLRTLLIALGVVTSAGAWVYTLMHANMPEKTETSTNGQPATSANPSTTNNQPAVSGICDTFSFLCS